MKLFIPSLLTACALGLISVSAIADTVAELTKKNNCLACHSVDKKILGPAFKDIAKKYKGNADAVSMLTKKVKEGGSGVWGAMPMSPNKNVSDADLKIMVEYVLSLN